MRTTSAHPVHRISEGTPMEVVTSLLGPPTSISTTAEVFGRYTVVGSVPKDTEWWLYRGTPSGHDTHIALRGGMVGAIRISLRQSRFSRWLHRIEPIPDVRLAHHTGTSTDRVGARTTTTFHYDTYPVRIARPVDGSVRDTVLCGTCHQQVEVVVPSARATRLRQRCLLVFPALSLVVGLYVFWYLVVRLDGSLAGPVLLTLWTVMSAGVTVVWLTKARNAHGVRVAPRRPHSRRHLIRRLPR